MKQERVEFARYDWSQGRYIESRYSSDSVDFKWLWEWMKIVGFVTFRVGV